MGSDIKIAMLGMIPGNGHPYSWSAIINGYDKAAMASCPYPVIIEYLSAQAEGSVNIPGACVTHIWTDDPSEALQVAAAALIDHVVDKPEDVIGKVDAVIIATDDGADHSRRAEPFIQAGIPVFIDKPLATTGTELKTFVQWKEQGSAILSSSGMRYAREFEVLGQHPWKWITGVVGNTWERYGIHLLEPVYRSLGPGFKSIRCHTSSHGEYFHLEHTCGTDVTLAINPSVKKAGLQFHAYGQDEHLNIRLQDNYQAFRRQLLAVVNWFKTGEDPYPFSETVQMMEILLAGITSRKQGGALITLNKTD